jgi:hypothetical protein
MHIDKLTNAIAEAERFIEKAHKAAFKIRTDSLTTISGSKETATCKRASMDLTRALADLRKPN